MRRNYFCCSSFFLCVMLFPEKINAQIAGKAVVHFSSDQSVLTADARNSVDSAVKSLANIPAAYKAEISGHTDLSGGDKLNAALSLDRAKNTAAYLARKYDLHSNDGIIAKSSSEPVADNNTEDGKALNRRAEINFVVHVPSPKDLGGITLPDIQFLLDNIRGGVFSYKTGTLIHIPPAAFADASGIDVQGNITLKYREFRDPIDFVLRDIPMSIEQNGELLPFNSRGMFEILAFKENKPVYLKPGKTIDIDFAVMKGMENMNFYKFDTVQHRWGELVHSGGMTTPTGLPGTGCSTYDCQAYLTFQNTGRRYSSDTALSLSSHNIDSLKKAQENLATRGSMILNDLYRVNNQILGEADYKIYQTASSGRTIFFTVNHPYMYGRNNAFNGISLKYKSPNDENLPQIIYKTNWEKMFLSPASQNGRYNMQFLGSVADTTLPGVEIQVTQKMRRRERVKFKSDFLHELEKANFLRTGKIDSLTKLRDSLQHEQTLLSKKIEEEKKIYDRDFMPCFWELNKPYMGADELLLEEKEWFTYFDSHRKKMTQRYAILNTDSLVKNCLEIKRLRLDAMRIADSVSNSVLKTFSINSLGIFNCDQIQRLDRPVSIYAKYNDENGKVVKPLAIYILDSKINGMLKYDGYNGLSPYHFAYSPYSRTTLLAVDERGKVYLSSSDQFKKLNTLNTQNYTFELAPLKKFKSRAELEALL